MMRAALLALLALLPGAAAARAPPPPARAAPVAARSDAVLSAYLTDRYVALAAPGASARAVAAAVQAAVASGLVRSGSTRADAPDMTNVALGVVTFKASNASATVRAARTTRTRRGLV